MSSWTLRVFKFRLMAYVDSWTAWEATFMAGHSCFIRSADLQVTRCGTQLIWSCWKKYLIWISSSCCRGVMALEPRNFARCILNTSFSDSTGHWNYFCSQVSSELCLDFDSSADHDIARLLWVGHSVVHNSCREHSLVEHSVTFGLI